MPKGTKIYAAERRQWLEGYEGGKSLFTIALASKRDIRTVSKQIHIAADERERAMARTELYRQSLSQHNDGLLRVLSYVRDSISVPHDERFTTLARFRYVAPFTSEGHPVSFVDGKPQVSVVGSGEDDVRLLELAQEHLQREKGLWTALDTWQEGLASYSGGCYRVGASAADSVAMRTGLELAPADLAHEGIQESFVSWLCRRAVEKASGMLPEGHGDRLRIAVEELRYGGSTLARSGSPEQLDLCKVVFLELVDTLADTPEVKQIVRLKKELVEEVPPLRRRLGDLLLMALVPGRCSVCNKLGM